MAIVIGCVSIRTIFSAVADGPKRRPRVCWWWGSTRDERNHSGSLPYYHQPSFTSSFSSSNLMLYSVSTAFSNILRRCCLRPVITIPPSGCWDLALHCFFYHQRFLRLLPLPPKELLPPIPVHITWSDEPTVTQSFPITSIYLFFCSRVSYFHLFLLLLLGNSSSSSSSTVPYIYSFLLGDSFFPFSPFRCCSIILYDALSLLFTLFLSLLATH